YQPIAVGFTVGSSLLTAFDAFVVWLTWREYPAKRKPRPISPPAGNSRLPRGSGAPRRPCASPGQVEGAVDGGFRDVGEAEVVAAGVVPHAGERLGQVDAGTLG